MTNPQPASFWMSKSCKKYLELNDDSPLLFSTIQKGTALRNWGAYVTACNASSHMHDSLSPICFNSNPALLMQLARQRRMVQVLRPPYSHKKTEESPGTWLFNWPNPGHCSHMASKTAVGRSQSFCLSCSTIVPL